MTRIRGPWWVAIQMALLLIAGIAVATAISSVMESRLSRPQGMAAADSARKAEAKRVRPVTDYLAMARRDLFAAPSEESDIVVGDAKVRQSSGDWKLLGTGGAGAAGFAIVEKSSGKEQQVVGVGEELDGAELKEVGWRRAILRRGGDDELLVVPADMEVEAAKKTASRSKAGAASDTNIQEIGADRWMVAQAEVEHQLQNLGTLFTQMRAVPNMKDGAADGFRVFAIRRNSLFQKLGLKNNDVVQRVNGMDLNNPARAMGLLEELKGETRLTVDVMRGGEPRTLTYEIR